MTSPSHLRDVWQDLIDLETHLRTQRRVVSRKYFRRDLPVIIFSTGNGIVSQKF